MNPAIPHLADPRAASTPRPDRLRIRIDLGPRPSIPEMATPASVRPEPKTIDIKIGTSVHSFRYWKTKWTNKKTRRVYSAYELAPQGGRRKEKRSTLKALRERCHDIAVAMENGETARLQLTAADQTSYLRAKESLAPIGVPVERAADIYTQCVQILSGRASVLAAVQDYLLHHPDGSLPKNIPDIVAKFFEKRRMGGKWRRVLKKMLERFAAKFTGSFTAVAGRDVDDWLDSLKDKKGKPVTLRTRRNYFEAIVSLASFTIAQGYAPKDWSILEGVTNPEPRKASVNIYSPQELAALLNFAESYEAGSKLVPFIAITAFAGVRHGEMNEEKIEHLDWRNVRFRTKRIIIGQDNEAKTNRARVVDMPENLIAWLKPYARPNGRICPLSNTSNALCRLRKKAVISLRQEAAKVANSERRRTLEELAKQLEGPKKNALRKSFISYRKALTSDIAKVAEEAGNSAAVIRQNYLHVDEEMREEAERWFAITPKRADVLPLFAWGKTA